MPVPDGITPEQASLAYLAQLGMAAMRQARYESGESVAVVGLGVIGLATVAIARAMGATVTAVANSALRGEVARQIGAHEVHVAGEGEAPSEIDMVVLTANPWSAFRVSVDMVADRRPVEHPRLPRARRAAPQFNPLDPKWFYGKQLTLIGAGLLSPSGVPGFGDPFQSQKEPRVFVLSDGDRRRLS